MADLFEDYRLGPGWDEMFGEPGMPRESYEALHGTLQPLSSAELGIRADVLARAFLDQGITFALKGVERPFPLDIVPRIIAHAEWKVVESGVQQRIRALEAEMSAHEWFGVVREDAPIAARAELERVHPASAWLAGESAHVQAEAGLGGDEHDLHAFQANGERRKQWRRGGAGRASDRARRRADGLPQR